MSFDGTISQLLKACDKAGVNRCLVHSVATTKEQVQKINDFIVESVKEYSDRFVGFGSLHPTMTQKEADDEIARMIEMGLLGIKLHPDFQYFNIDEKCAMELYEVVDNRLPILFHTGDKRFSYSTPSRLANAGRIKSLILLIPYSFPSKYITIPQLPQFHIKLLLGAL